MACWVLYLIERKNMYLEKIRKIIFEKTGVVPEEVVPAAHFEDDLNIGELEFIEILEEVEEIFHVDLSEYKDKAETIETVAELINILSDELD